ncbi:MAG TPA: FAD-binding protein, partial [Oscillospiraceae bacterium]|nr:FAD-binding protein [Oscillospiraceae bacterium]
MTAPKIPISRCTVAIVGTGAAGYNAALCLKSLGVTDIIMVSEGKLCGTSRNTGSDKQTYYKISQGGAELDSVRQMAQTLFDGGSMHGDIALVHSALSARGFYKLVELGVPFPFNRFGEYAGYKTDHDPARRGSSIGPLTSKVMTEQLERAVGDVKLMDGYRVARIFTDNGSCKGLLLVSIATGELTAINASSVIFATGGPAHIYAQSVYPHSQTGATGIALAAGTKGANLGEWQYGLASTEFRWNVSGTYQQVLPRYISTDQNGGDEREFIADYYSSNEQMLENIFRKGYQWPFDAKRTEGSSRIDLLVYNETVIHGRRVYMDFTRNPSCIGEQLSPSYENLSDEVSSYLQSSGALFGTPIERLAHMNPQAIEIYASNGIDLYSQPLEVAVCAQHNNGGLAGNLWFESNIKRLFPVGEVAGSFGAARPGGS